MLGEHKSIAQQPDKDSTFIIQLYTPILVRTGLIKLNETEMEEVFLLNARESHSLQEL